ncbi:hypothetical protein CLV35_0913 [Motilibacter peucedani]|uniref:DUF6458 domain-containing protein n=2 Tax=Motilibacter peucedani TaxID=598650 RepID=A0A420XUH4_9ACTN|nr:hypothetical protein CLV35_0913 [Motilibacter peucedani]
MGIGIGILLIAAGLILALAVDATVSGLDIQVVGWILVAAGVLGLVLELALFAPRRRYPGAVAPDVRERTVYQDRPVVEERRVYDDPRY